MLNKLLNDFKEKMIAEDKRLNTIKNYISDVRTFCKWYQITCIVSLLKKEKCQYYIEEVIIRIIRYRTFS